MDTCKECKWFKDKSDGRDSGCYKQTVPVYRLEDDPACVQGEPKKIADK